MKQLPQMTDCQTDSYKMPIPGGKIGAYGGLRGSEEHKGLRT